MAAQLLAIEKEGLTVSVIFEQETRLPLVSLQLVFRDSGALTDQIPGVAKLTAKLLGEGSKALGSEGFAEALESRAITLSASVGAETFVISLQALESEFAFGFEMLCALLADPNMTAEAFGKVQTQMVGTLTQKQSDFDYVANLLLKKTLFAGTPRAHPSSGTAESVGSITLDDIRAYQDAYLGRGNFVMVLGGDIQPQEAEKMVAGLMAVLPPCTVSPLQEIQATGTPQTRTHHASTEQAYLYFGAPYQMPYGSDEVYLGKVASFVLGSSGFGSRLMEEVRVKRGLAYSAYASFSVSRTGSYMTGHLQTKLESASEAKGVVTEVVRTFISEGITQEELDAAKQFLVGSEPLRNETLQQRIGNAFHAYYNGKPLDYRKEELRQIEAIELEQINCFIRAHTEIGKISFAIVEA